jgi:hypothetical protein
MRRFAVGEDGRKVWPSDHYAIEGARITDWLAKGVVKQHRTMGTTLNTLIGTGFTIRHIQEWHPTAGQIASQPRAVAATEPLVDTRQHIRDG